MKKALITGASRGIGRAIAEKLAGEGYDLYLICEKTIDALNALCSDLSDKYGVTARAYRADVADFDALSKIFAEIGDIDVLINNAGISYVGLLSDMDVTDWDRIVSVNLSSAFYTCKLAVPGMVRNHKGTIINISSVWGNIGASTEVAYSATKGGINSFTKALAKELAPSNISVNAVACGFVDTDMNKNLSPEERESVKEEIPADRFASAGEIADCVSSILSAPTYLTGQVITVDGGWT